MIKLKNILREAGLLGEQANQSQVLNVEPGTTQQQFQQQLDDSKFDLNNPVTINLTFARSLPDNDVPRPIQITQLQTTLTAINTIGQNVSAVVNAGTTTARATGTGAPVDQFTQGGGAFVSAFPNIAQAYPVTNNETSNNFLLLNRAGSVYQAAINAGIQNVTTTIPTDGAATRQTKFATLSVTGIFKKTPEERPKFGQFVRSYDIAKNWPSWSSAEANEFASKLINSTDNSSEMYQKNRFGYIEASPAFMEKMKYNGVPQPELLNTIKRVSSIDKNNQIEITADRLPIIFKAFEVNNFNDFLNKLRGKV
jgi:hypothetical protein